MKITVLDGNTINPGDLSWENFKKLGDFTVYDRTKNDEIYDRAKDSEILITNKTPITADLIERLPNLKYIGALSTGFNIIDTDFAKTKGITVTNIPTYCTGAVAQMIFALILEITNQVGCHADSVNNKEWQNCKDFCYWKTDLIELENKTMGILGFGKIGQATAKIAAAMGMKVLAYSRTANSSPIQGVEIAPMQEVLSKSDIVSVSVPLTAQTEKMINEDTIALMKPTAILINTSRGAVVDDDALARALKDKKIYAAGLDVLTIEPPKQGNALIGLQNCFITPHISWASKEARSRLMEIACENVVKFLEGTPQNVV